MLNSKPILVLGGGQLGLMLAEAAAHLGQAVDRIDTNTDELIPGTSNFRISQSLEELLDRYDAITAEMEHLPDTDLVKNLRQSPLWMNARAMNILPSRRQQKTLLDEISVANAPWRMLEKPEDLAEAHQTLGETLIVKTTRGGYDGKGQWVINHGDDHDIPASAFGRLIAEQKIGFSREVSLVGARDKKGNTCYFPLTENYHYQGILRFSLAPASATNELQLEAEQMLKTIMDELDYIGVMAMECFEIDGHLMVNELAPRVHNSGHWTQSGTGCSQFELHIRALAEINFPEVLHCKPTLMLNLIGCEYNSQWHQVPGIYCYWYGKDRRDGRKLGHINITDIRQQDQVSMLRSLLDDEHQMMLDRGIEIARGCL